MKNSDKLKSALNDLRGCLAWRPVRIHGSMFFLDVGREVNRKKSERLHGEWIFTFESASWSIYKYDDCLVSSEDDTSMIDGAFLLIEPGEICGIIFNDIDLSMCIYINNGVKYIISCSDYGDECDMTQFNIFDRNDDVFIIKNKEIIFEQN